MPTKKRVTKKNTKAKKKVDDRESLSDVEGEGFKDFFQAAKRVVTKLWYGDKSLPQDCVKFLEKNGEAIVESATINRKPDS